LIFVLLRTTLGGAVLWLDRGDVGSVLPTVALIGLLCLLGARSAGSRQLVEVELWAGEKCERLLALLDTGNTLTDPVTGSGVLVADARSAEVLLGLTAQQLARPVETLAAGTVKGLRLIPYRSVGQAGGLLLAVRLDRVRIGNRFGSAVVAFAPEGLGGEGTYRALVGGMLCG
jgi:stage II sporulation protein GA (sporulation sigma-E factor processing peptidase)